MDVYQSLPDGQRVVPVSSTSSKWSDDFNGSVLADDKWEVVENTGGMTYSVATSNLTVTMGVNANARLRLLSRQKITIPFDVYVSFLMSQRIANNDFYVDLIEVDPITGVPISNVNKAGDWSNRASARFNGTVATSWIIEALGEAAAQVATSTIANMPTTATAADLALELRAQDVLMSGTTSDSASIRSSAVGRISSSLPDPNKAYKLQLRFENGATAPATSTSVTVKRVALVDIQELVVEISSGRGDNNPNKAIAANIASAIPAGSNTIGGVNVASALPAGSNVVGSTVPSQNATVGSGTTAHSLIAAATINATVVKAAAGKLIGGLLKNVSAAVRYVKLYNKATAPVPGTDVPILRIPLNAGETVNLNSILGTTGHTFSAGISYVIVVNQADADATVVAAGDVVVNLVYA